MTLLWIIDEELEWANFLSLPPFLFIFYLFPHAARSRAPMLAGGAKWGKSAYTDALISPLLRQWWLRDMWCKQSRRMSERTHFSAAIYNVVPGTAEGTLTVPVIPAPSRSFALWLRCNHGSFGRLWKWSKQTEMDGEINSIQCPESAGCTVYLIAPSYRHRSYHERMLGPMRYCQFARFSENVSKLQVLQTKSMIWISTGQAWPSRSDAGANRQQANWKFFFISEQTLLSLLLKENIYCRPLFWTQMTTQPIYDAIFQVFW